VSLFSFTKLPESCSAVSVRLGSVSLFSFTKFPESCSAVHKTDSDNSFDGAGEFRTMVSNEVFLALSLLYYRRTKVSNEFRTKPSRL
jgi:hypothetical protein